MHSQFYECCEISPDESACAFWTEGPDEGDQTWTVMNCVTGDVIFNQIVPRPSGAAWVSNGRFDLIWFPETYYSIYTTSKSRKYRFTFKDPSINTSFEGTKCLASDGAGRIYVLSYNGKGYILETSIPQKAIRISYDDLFYFITIITNTNQGLAIHGRDIWKIEVQENGRLLLGDKMFDGSGRWIFGGPLVSVNSRLAIAYGCIPDPSQTTVVATSTIERNHSRWTRLVEGESNCRLILTNDEFSCYAEVGANLCIWGFFVNNSHDRNMVDCFDVETGRRICTWKVSGRIVTIGVRHKSQELIVVNDKGNATFNITRIGLS